MQFSTVLIALAASVVSTMAVAVPEPVAVADPAGDVEKRDNTVYVCTAGQFTGQCKNISPPYNTCQSWSSIGLSGLGSWGPSQGTYCVWYNKPCGAGDYTASGTITYPGYSEVPAYWKFNTQSWKCWW